MFNVVVIEDDLDFAEILQESLESDPTYRVLALCQSEASALSWIASADLGGLDCALVDLVLPKEDGDKEAKSISGIRIVQELRQNSDFNGVIIVLTNSKQLEDGQRALQAGCDGYLCKHAPMDEVEQMLEELKLAMHGNVLLFSREMRHVFMREELSSKEAKLMELIHEGSSWAEIAKSLNYSSANAAATVGYRVFDKILRNDLKTESTSNENKRSKALEKWRARTGRQSATSSTKRL